MHYAIYIIDYDKKQFLYKDGIKSEELTNQVKKGFNLQSNRIKAFYGQRELHDLEYPVDVFAFDKSIVEGSYTKLYELIVFHEVCHLLEKREYYKELGVELNDKKMAVGIKLNYRANENSQWGRDEDHNEMFGAILFHFLYQYDLVKSFHLLGEAMKFNFGDNYSVQFKKAFNSID